MTAKTVNLINPKRVALIWLICAFCFFTLFRMALHNSSQTFSSASTDSQNSYTEQRSKLYDKMGRDLDEHGAAFLKHGETSQSLSLSDIFTLKDGYVTPVMKPANPPVRANVLYLSTEFSLPIAEAVKNNFNPYFDKAIWFQNSSLYHFSMFHASHHIVPVLATKEEIEAEASSVKAVVSKLCPLKIVLDRVVLTSTGVLLGCWQLLSLPDTQLEHLFLEEINYLLIRIQYVEVDLYPMTINLISIRIVQFWNLDIKQRPAAFLMYHNIPVTFTWGL
ncbi:uncharacterized protein LOC124845382 isoform X2 [Vigna umbellata]|uniref:uncharacterized protein LOC124845382 isoform X2 n=1 Tax=Vigna umbellata TaxID=87088 RepID=UPI001F5EB088|nr:uncharacterized protein LOC124845382 isoform X2 [Vigna umbellata]